MRKILVALLVAGTLFAGWKIFRPHRPDAPSLIFDRIWLERAPARLTEHVHGLVILRAVPIGVFQKASAYEAHLERFDYLVERDGVRMRFPQSERRATVDVKVRACDEKPPFDLCLELSQNPWGGPRRYYSWREQPRHGLDEATRGVVARMQAEARP